MSKTEKNKTKEKRRVFDETGRRLLKEIWPLRGWILFAAFLCLLIPQLVNCQSFALQLAFITAIFPV